MPRFFTLQKGDEMKEQMQEQMLMLISKQLEEITRMLEKQYQGSWGQIGRPTKEHDVLRYRENYPTAGKMECVRATGLSIKTVSKYWGLYEESEEKEILTRGA